MRLLLVRLSWFGDVLLTLPVVDALASAGIRVELMTSWRFADLFTADARLDAVRVVDGHGSPARWGVYDAVVDLHSSPLAPDQQLVVDDVVAGTRVGAAHSGRGDLVVVEPRRHGEHAVTYYARVVSAVAPVAPARGLLSLSDDEARSRTGDAGVWVLPGARESSRRWPAERYATLVDELVGDGLSVTVAGHEADRDRVDAVLSGCQTSPSHHVTADVCDLASRFAAAAVVVGNNSALVHLAALTGGPRAVCIESHLVPGMWDPWGEGHTVLRGEAGGCSCTGEAPSLAAECATTIPAAAVVDAVREIAAAPRAPS